MVGSPKDSNIVDVGIALDGFIQRFLLRLPYITQLTIPPSKVVGPYYEDLRIRIKDIAIDIQVRG
jgi:hypothetical protein